MNIRLTTLIVGNVVGVIVILYFLEIFGMFSVYTQIKNLAIPAKQQKKFEQTRGSDISLLEEVERQKVIESFAVKEVEIARASASISNERIQLEKERLSIQVEKENLEKQKEQLEKIANEKNAYANKVKDLSSVYYNMPPNSAVERILELKDDLLILDVLQEITKYSQTQGSVDVVPYLYSLMPKEDAARLLKKLTVML